MARGTLADRVENLENAVDSLRQVPARVGALEVRMSGVESQIVQLRHETRDGFSAMELRFEDLRSDGEEQLTRAIDELRNEISVTAGQLRGELSAAVSELRVEIRAGDEETRRYMRLLFEEYVERIARTRESGPSPGRRKRNR